MKSFYRAIDNKFWIYGLDCLIVVTLVYGLYASVVRLQVSQRIESLVERLEPEPSTFDSDLQGIDVSHYQGKVQWQTVEKFFNFAFVKATEGERYIDPRFADNLSSLEKTGLSFAAYHFFLPSDDPLKQAKHFIKTTESFRFSLPPVLDVEVPPSGNDTRKFVKAVQEWLSYVQQHMGCQPIIYTSRSFWNQYLAGHFSGSLLWISDYTSEEGRMAAIPWSFWQFTDKARIDGIAGRVDQSRFKGDQASLQALGGCQV